MSDLARRLEHLDSEIAQLAEAARYFGTTPARLQNRWCDLRYRAGNGRYESMADLLAAGAVQESELREAS